MKTEELYARESYILESDMTTAMVTKTGAHVMADFKIGDRKINPFFVAPWWGEDCSALVGTCDYPLRGIFFGLPFGITKPDNGMQRPCHGFVPARDWELLEEKEKDSEKTVTLSVFVPEENATVKQSVTVREGETVLYISNSVKGVNGAYSVGYHPTLQLPDQLGSAIVDMSEYKLCLTSPTHIDSPEKGGYCSLLTNYQIVDETDVPTVYGQHVNLKKQPFVKGFDDIYMYVFDQTHEFDYAAVSVPSEGYLYYQLKNPKQLSNSMIWTSYCGRHYGMWKGRVNGCIEIGAATNYFFYGMAGKKEDNPLTDHGYQMYHEFDGSEQEYKLISGVVEIPEDYQGVASIAKKNDGTILIKGHDGSVIETACNVAFLK